MRVPSILLLRQSASRILAEHNARPRRKTGIRRWNSAVRRCDSRYYLFGWKWSGTYMR